jgi:hypothetical protein
MKRSEMVSVISMFLEDWYGEYNATKVADKLLTQIEREGMVPTLREVRNVDYPEFGMPTKLTHEWEPEDE